MEVNAHRVIDVLLNQVGQLSKEKALQTAQIIQLQEENTGLKQKLEKYVELQQKTEEKADLLEKGMPQSAKAVPVKGEKRPNKEGD